MATQKIDPKVIFASNAPAIDNPPIFSDKTKGWDVARANDGRPTIKEMNKVQQDTDLKILWLNENSVTPYDASIDYPDGAVTLKDGSFKQLASGAWVEFLDDFANRDEVKRGIANRYDLSLTYNSGERVILTNGDIVKSTINGNTNDPNVDMTGWVNPKKYQDWINSQCPTVLQLNSAIKGDGITNDAVGLQALARIVDTTFKPYMFLPFYNNSYKLDSTVVIQEPMMLWGDAVPTYNRGDGKQGKILLNTPIGFNLGNGRVTGSILDIDNKISKNAADQWTVKNITLLPFNSATQQFTQTAILCDSKNNGPDRGFIMREVSGSRLNHVIRVKDNDVQTHLATMVVEGCVLSNNNIPILADGNVFGARFSGNQIEQNNNGAIHGVFHAGLTIHDNMLEGNKNTIYIKDHPQDRNGCYLSLERNYFELNSGDYLVKVESFQSNSIISRGNYVAGFLSSDGITPNTERNRPTDHFLLTNSYSSINILDQLSVSFFGGASCTEDNNLSKFLVYADPSSFVCVNSRLEAAVSLRENSASVSNISVKVSTDIGEIYEVRNSNNYTVVPLVVNAGDVVQLCFSYYSDESNLRPSLITIMELGVGGVALVPQAGFRSDVSNGKIRTANYIFTVPTTATGGRSLMFRLDLNDKSKSMSILGASAKKIGTYTTASELNVINRFVVEKCKPVFRYVSDGLFYSTALTETIIPVGGNIVLTYTVNGATNLNRVVAILGSYINGSSSSARVSAPNTVQVTISNTVSEPITIANGTLLEYTVF